MLDESFVHDMKVGISDFIDAFANYNDLQTISRIKGKAKYKSDRDFWFGYIVGRLEGEYSLLLRKLGGRSVSNDEVDEIERIVESYYPLMRQRISEKFDRMNEGF